MVKMEKVALELKNGDHLLSFDLTAGYRHVKFHTLMLNYVLFRYGGSTHRCLAVKRGSSLAAKHFTIFVSSLVVYMRNVLEYRVRWYLEDFLIEPSGGKASTAADFLPSSARLYHVFERFFITRHPKKGVR